MAAMRQLSLWPLTLPVVIYRMIYEFCSAQTSTKIRAARRRLKLQDSDFNTFCPPENPDAQEFNPT